MFYLKIYELFEARLRSSPIGFYCRPIQSPLAVSDKRQTFLIGIINVRLSNQCRNRGGKLKLFQAYGDEGEWHAPIWKYGALRNVEIQALDFLLIQLACE